MSHRPREGNTRGRSTSPDGGGALTTKERIVRGLRVIAQEPDLDERQRALAKDRIRDALGRVLVDGQLPSEEK